MEPMGMLETIAVVAECCRSEMQTFVMYACLAALGVCLSVLFAVKVMVPVWENVRRFLSLPRLQQCLLLFCIVGLVHYGATKQKGSTFTFDGGIKQNPIQPSYSTNSTVSISWMRDMSGGVYVPESAAVYIDYKVNSDSNAVWQLLAETTVGAWSWSGTVANATNYDYNAWAYYIPPEPVHTNGVWLYKTQKDRNDRYPIPLRTRIEINGKAISTPKEKRKDEGND